MSLTIPNKNPAANKSPAPVVSITFSHGKDGTSSISFSLIIIDPSAPLVITDKLISDLGSKKQVPAVGAALNLNK